MSHGIRRDDNVFSVRKPAWHDLAEVWPDYPTRKQAQEFAHNWEPVSEPLFRHHTWINPDGTLGEKYEEIKGSVLNVRSDTHIPLGVVSSTFEPVLNSEMYDIAEAIEGGDPSSVRYETGGSLFDGRKVWLLIRMKEPFVVKGDPRGATIPYYALQNDHGGMGSFRGQVTMTRIVCDNTAHAADMDAQMRGTEFVFSHTASVHERIEQAKQALLGWRDSIEEYRRISEHLVTRKITPSQTQVFIHKFIPMPPPHMASKIVQGNVLEARRVWTNVLNGETCQGVENTAYGLVQASIEYSQHYRKARSNETRFKRAYLDQSRITSDAVELARLVSR